MHRSRLPFITLYIALILGCLGGILFVFVLPYLPIGNWSHYEQLPSKALQFMGHDDEEDFFAGVYIEAADGLMYRCQDLDSPCVASQEFDPKVYPGTFRTCGAPLGIAPLTPGKVIDTLSYRFCGIDSSEDRYYLILDDGSVWKWSSPGTGTSNFSFFLICGLLGAGAGALVWLLSKRSMERKKEKAHLV
ncbi:MAG: hypothetical protein QM730_01510 [Anaerolineales bacterium]